MCRAIGIRGFLRYLEFDRPLDRRRSKAGPRRRPVRHWLQCSARSSMASPSSSSASEMVSGLRMRMVLALTPHDSRTSPSPSAAVVTCLVASASGSLAAARLTMSKATIAPGPRIEAMATVSLRARLRQRRP